MCRRCTGNINGFCVQSWVPSPKYLIMYLQISPPPKNPKSKNFWSQAFWIRDTQLVPLPKFIKVSMEDMCVLLNVTYPAVFKVGSSPGPASYFTI
jgi:hypothetical protein